MKILKCGFVLGLVLGMFVVVVPAMAEGEAEGESKGEFDQAKVSIGTNGLQVESPDGKFKFKFGGRIHADASVVVGDTPANTPASDDPLPDGTPGVNRDATDGVEIRRARFVAKATVYENWNWTGEVDFADNGTSVKDFLVDYSGFDGVIFGIGNQKKPFSLAIEMSANDLPFIERGIDTTMLELVLDRAIGVRADASGENWFVAAGFFGESLVSAGNNAAEGWSAVGKAVFTPLLDEDSVIHLGFRVAVRRPETRNESTRFRDELTHMADYRVINTGSIQNIDENYVYGPEAAIAFGRFSVFGEYNRLVLTRSGANTLHFEGGHIGATLSLTGESRAAAYTIKSAEFKRLKSKKRFGAWELAARYAYADVSHGSATDPGAVDGGTESVFTTALNWYPNDVMRFTLDWSHVIETDIGAGASASQIPFNQEGKGLNAFTLRMQFNF